MVTAAGLVMVLAVVIAAVSEIAEALVIAAVSGVATASAIAASVTARQIAERLVATAAAVHAAV